MKRMLALGLVLAAAGLVLSCGGGEEKGPAATGGPAPIVILAIDGLRADALGCYGGFAATPAFDALASESIRFEWAFAQAPQIQPSLGALVSGLYPTTSGLRSPGDYLADEAETLAEILGSAGYSTAAFVEGGPGTSDYGLAQGFDSYQTLSEPGAAAVEWMKGRAGENFLLVLGGWSQPALEQVRALLAGTGRPEGMEARIQEVLASRSSGSPVDFNEDDLEWVRSWYAARVQVIDSLFGNFMNEFRALGLDEKAILVVIGSNGFALQERGGLFGETLDPAVTHVPVFLRMPGGGDVRAVSKIVEVIDLMPTLLELSGQTAPAAVQSASLVPILDGAGQPPYVAFAESPQDGGQRMVALGGLAMVSGVAGAEAQLFDLASGEMVSAPDKAEVMVRHLQAWEKMVSVASLDPELRTEEDLDEDTLKQLKSLGYIQ